MKNCCCFTAFECPNYRIFCTTHIPHHYPALKRCSLHDGDLLNIRIISSNLSFFVDSSTAASSTSEMCCKVCAAASAIHNLIHKTCLKKAKSSFTMRQLEPAGNTSKKIIQSLRFKKTEDSGVFFCQRTNGIHKFEGCFLRGQVCSNDFKGLHRLILSFISPFAKKLENLLLLKAL